MDNKKVMALFNKMVQEQNHVSCRGFNDNTRKLAKEILQIFGASYDIISEIPIIEDAEIIIAYSYVNEKGIDTAYELCIYKENDILKYSIEIIGEYDKNDIIYLYVIHRIVKEGSIQETKEDHKMDKSRELYNERKEMQSNYEKIITAIASKYNVADKYEIYVAVIEKEGVNQYFIDFETADYYYRYRRYRGYYPSIEAIEQALNVCINESAEDQAEEIEEIKEASLYVFRYHVELEKGFLPVMGDTEENDLFFDIQAKNRVTADRMVRAMLIGNINVADLSGICIGRVGEDIIYT